MTQGVIIFQPNSPMLSLFSPKLLRFPSLADA
jgi:hypothetical protein